MRGKVLSFIAIVALQGITPAYAGKSHHPELALIVVEDHPCVCGEKLSFLCKCFSSAGSPLRMRGKVKVREPELFSLGITPAYAGKRRTES